MQDAPPSPSKSGSTSDKVNKASLGAFALSLLVHGAVILLVGGYVVFEGVIPKSPFIAVEGAVNAPVDEIPEPEQPQEMMDTPVAPTSELNLPRENAAPGEATSADIIVSSGANPSFSLPPAVAAPSATPRLGFGSGTKGNSEGRGTGSPQGGIIRSLFGTTESSPSTLKGTMYDLKQTRGGKPTKADYLALTNEFSQKWDTGVFRDYYKVDTSLYATHLFIPLIKAAEAPKAFNVEDKVQPSQWVIVYEGTFTAPASETYRFVGYADDILMVGVNGQLVLDGSRPTIGFDKNLGAASAWKVTPDTLLRHKIGNGQLAYGDWIPLQAGQPNQIHILLGERPGGFFCGFLLIQEKGKKYEVDAKSGGRPILPLFRTQTAEISFPPDTNPANIPVYESRGPVFRNP